MRRQRVIVGLSGGVDSAVSAWLLKQQGHEVVGIFMKNWEDDDDGEYCSSNADFVDAAAVADVIGIEIEHVNFAAEYKDRVFAEFLREYAAGRTPNPDVLCNREIKFKTFLEHARALGAGRIATGHYARTDVLDGRHRLLRARDANKDQSYFLHTLGQEQLAATVFPIGEMAKPDVRRMASAADLPTHAKKDSTGICFIGERDFREFLGRYIPARPGEMRTPDGTPIGEHAGTMYYTLGQRDGLGIGGRRDAGGEPWYVVGKNVADNVLYVAQGVDNVWLQSSMLVASSLSWVAGAPPASEFACTAKTRYRQVDQECRVRIDGDDVQVHFAHAQRAVTPGQSVVFYAGDECLGGGVIDATDAPFGGLNGGHRVQ
jgi:tRNA-specific 2-thiouridylase